MSRPVRFLLYKPIVMIGDVCLVNAGFLIAFFLRRDYLLTPHANLSSYLNLAALVSLTTLVIFQLLDLYRDWLRRSLRHVLYSVIIAGHDAAHHHGPWLLGAAVRFPTQRAPAGGLLLRWGCCVATVYKCAVCIAGGAGTVPPS